MVDGDGGLWSLSVDDGTLGDGGASLLMMEPLEMVEPCWRCLVDALCLHSLH